MGVFLLCFILLIIHGEYTLFFYASMNLHREVYITQIRRQLDNIRRVCKNKEKLKKDGLGCIFLTFYILDF